MGSGSEHLVYLFFSAVTQVSPTGHSLSWVQACATVTLQFPLNAG
jgi:hypothetical protein